MSEDHIERANRHITPALVFHTDIAVKRARGLFVEGTDGKTYMDFTSGLATVNIGHCPQEVLDAARAQMEVLLHSGCIFRYESEIRLAERLSEISPGAIDMFFFSNSGAEAVEGAIKLARYVTQRQGIIAFTGAFHGRTMGAVSLTASSTKYRQRYQPLLPSVYHAPYPYCYRCPVGRAPQDCSVECFGCLESILKRQIPPDEVACVIIEPVLGEGGYVPAPARFLQKLKGLCEREGILFIADEVQGGFGRTGKWFSCEHSGVKPDIITAAKGIASGFPLGAIGSSREIMEKWRPGAHGTTFGGNPVACAAAIAGIEVIEKEGLFENAQRLGDYALARLRSMQEKNKAIGDVRGLGLMIGVEFVKEDKSPDRALLEKIMGRCLEKGLVIIECGMEKNIARLMPPLVTKPSEMEKALDILEEALV